MVVKVMKGKAKPYTLLVSPFYKCSSRFPKSGLGLIYHENLALQELNKVTPAHDQNNA